MNHRILIAYVTKTGTAQEVAEVVGQVLREAGAEVDVRPANQVRDLRPYGAVVLGSAVLKFKLLPRALAFAKKHQAALGPLPTAYFVVCLTMREDTPENRQTVAGYLEPLRQLKEPVSVGMFGGRMDYARLGLFMRFLTRNPDVAREMPEGDFRDWDAIRAWARSLVPVLQPQ